MSVTTATQTALITLTCDMCGKYETFTVTLENSDAQGSVGIAVDSARRQARRIGWLTVLDMDDTEDYCSRQCVTEEFASY